MITQSVIFFNNSFTMKYKTKIKVNRNKKPPVREYTSNCYSYLGVFKYCLHVKIIPGERGARQMHYYYNILCIREPRL